MSDSAPVAGERAAPSTAPRSHRRIEVDPLVFGASAAAVGALLVFGLGWTELAARLFTGLQDWIVGSFAWLFVLAVTFFLGFSIWIACSRVGRVPLGPAGEPPAFSTLSWIAMLFAAGMGIGLVFYGVAEPVLHYASPPVGEGGTVAAAREAMRLSLFHWGLHAWGVYACLGLALAYFHHRRGMPLAIRSPLRPVLGDAADRWPGKLVDVIAVLGTVFGLATSLGLGSMQINAGLERLFGVSISLGHQVAIIAVITACATISVVTGLERGIRRLSELNMLLAAALLLFVLAAGPTAAILQGIPDHLGSYLQRIPAMSLSTHAFRDSEWQKSWTIFYWAWWISWAPFVGVFIARISRGRTVRQFVLAVLLLPTLLSLVWFGVFGGAALDLELSGARDLAGAVQENVATAIYVLLESFPLAGLSSVVAVAVVAIFFVTSSDSGSFVVDMLSSGGHPDPPVWQRVFWALTEGAVAAVLLATGGLVALRSAAINTGLLFALVMIVVCLGLARALREERV